MATVFMTDPATGRVALYDEPNTNGEAGDPNSPRNAPLNNPNANLAFVYYHSDFDPMEVAIGPQNVTINHTEIPAGTGSGGGATVNGSRAYGNVERTNVLLNHNLGYIPSFFILSGQDTVNPGFPIQFDPIDGRARCVTAYATSNQIILYENGIQTSNVLPAISVTYTILVLRNPPAASGNILFDFDPVTGLVQMAKGKFRSDRRYLQITSGGTPFAVPLGRTVDLKNGAPRTVSTSGSARDIIPSSFRVSYGYRDGPLVFGPDGNYNGNFTGSGFIPVQAP